MRLLDMLAAIPPALIAVVIGLVYVYFGVGRWRLWMLIDAGLLAIYLARPSLGMLAFVLLLLAVRHTPAFARELAVLFKLDEFDGWTARAILFALPALDRRPVADGKTTALDMSSAAHAGLGATGTPLVHVPVPRTSTAPDAAEVVRADTDAENTAFELPRISRHNTDREVVVYLAVQLRTDGKPRYSANKIYDLVGGSRADVLKIVADVRSTATYRPLTEAQQQAREELGLPQK